MPRVRGRRKKTRTHVREEGIDTNVPRSIIMRHGVVPEPISQLIQNLRQVMEPNTARHLVERTKTKLRDVVSVCGPLGVSHIVTLSQNSYGTNMRVIRVPRGPTLTFRVLEYSLRSDLSRMQKRPVSIEKHLLSAPLVVLNNMAGHPIVAAMFQNMFPSINVTTVKLSACRRLALFSYDEDEDCIHFRHYLINASPTGVSKSVRMLVKSRVPNLHRYNDISEVVMNDAGLASDSEAEDLPESKVTLPQDFVGRGNRRSHQSAIRLAEIGPRMKLQLNKIEDGVGTGEVIYNRFVSKTPEEIAELEKVREERRLAKERRRKEQEANVQRKKEAAEDKKRRKRRRTASKSADVAESDGDEEEFDAEDSDNAASEGGDDTDDEEWYRREVGEEPDHDIGFKNNKKAKRSRK